MTFSFLRLALITIAFALSACSSAPVESSRPPQKSPRFDGKMVVQQGHTESVNGLVYAHSGRFIATGGKDSTIRIWRPDGRLIRTIPTGFWVGLLAITPDDHLVAAGYNGTLRIWDALGNALTPAKRIKSMFSALAVSPDGKIIALGNGQGTLFLADSTLTKVRIVSGKKWGNLKALAFSPDGRHLAAGYYDGGIRIWSREGKLERQWKAHPAQVTALAFHPGKDFLASASAYLLSGEERRAAKPKQIKLWRIDGTPVAALKAHSSQCLRFDRDGSRLISGGLFDGKIKIFTLADKHSRDIRVSRGSARSPRLVALSPDGTQIVSADNYFNPPGLNIWDFAGHRLARLRRATGEVRSVAMAPDGAVFATTGLDRTVRIWSASGRLLKRLTGFSEFIDELAFSPNGRLLAGAGEELILWDRQGNELVRTKAHKNGTNGLAFSADGTQLFTAGGDGRVNRYDLKTGKVVRYRIYHDRVQSLTLHPSGKVFATGNYGGDFDLWDIKGRHLLHHDEVHKKKYGVASPTYALAFAPDGKRLAVATTDWRNEVRIFDLKGHLLKVLASYNRKQWGEILFSPSGRWLVTNSNNDIAVWDGRTYKLYGAMKGHTGPVSDMSFSRDERWVVSGAGDGTVRLWNTRNTASAAMLADGDDWIVYTDDGYFDASRYGGDLVAMVKGLNVYSVDQFALKYNRPDIILKRLGIPAPRLIDHFRQLHERRLRKADFLGRLLPGTLHAPTVAVESRRQSGKRLTLKIRLKDEVDVLKSYQIYANGVPLMAGAGKPVGGHDQVVSESVELTPGKNKIEITATNAQGAASPLITTYASYRGKASHRLFFVGVGVSDYGDPRLDLHYADKDALDLKAAFRRYSKRFDAVRTLTLTDKEATRDHILSDIRSFLKETKASDTVVVSLSGHGAYDRTTLATYYFIPYGVTEDLSASAVSFRELESLLAAIPARRRLLLIDACESGEIDPAVRARIIATAKEHGLSARATLVSHARKAKSTRPFLYDRSRYIYNDVVRRSGIAVFSSSHGGELSMESPKLKNGIFTRAVIDALGSRKTDRNHDHYISFDELVNRVANTVSAVTGGLQNPIVDRDNLDQTIRFPVQR